MKPGDKLSEAYINSLPQLYTKDGFPVHDIEIQTGLFRIDVSGQLEVRHIGGEPYFKESNGNKYEIENFYLELSNENT